MGHPTRRQFLKLTSAGIATATVSTLIPQAASGGQAPFAAGSISVRVTAGQARFRETAPLAWQAAKGSPEPNAIVLEPDKKYQEILGFGAAFTDAACYVFNQLTPVAREELFHELFQPSEMGLNVCRTCIGSSDYSTEAYSFD